MSLIDVIFGDEIAQYPSQSKPEPTKDRNYKIDPSMKVGVIVTDGANKVALYEDKPEPSADDRNYRIDPSTKVGSIVTNGANKVAMYGTKPEPIGNQNYIIDPSTKVGTIVNQSQTVNGKTVPVTYQSKPDEPSSANPLPAKTYTAEYFVSHFKNAILTNEKYRLADRRFFIVIISPESAGLFNEAILRDLTFLVQEIDLPTLAINDNQKNIDTELGSFRTPDLNAKLQTDEQNFNIKFLDTEYSFIEEFFFSWMQMVMNPYKLTSNNSSNFPRASVYVQFFDNANRKMILMYKINGVYPTRISPPTASYGEGRGGITRQVTFHFNNMEVSGNWTSSDKSASKPVDPKANQKTSMDWRTGNLAQVRIADNSVTSDLERGGQGYNKVNNKTDVKNGLNGNAPTGKPNSKISDMDKTKNGLPNASTNLDRMSNLQDALSKFPDQMRSMNKTYQSTTTMSNPTMTIPDRIPVESTRPTQTRDRTFDSVQRPVVTSDHVDIGMRSPATRPVSQTYKVAVEGSAPSVVENKTASVVVVPRPLPNKSNVLLSTMRPSNPGVKADIDWNKHKP